MERDKQLRRRQELKTWAWKQCPMRAKQIHMFFGSIPSRSSRVKYLIPGPKVPDLCDMLVGLRILGEVADLTRPTINTKIQIAILGQLFFTRSTAQGGGGSFKNRKPIGEVGCCESGMAERSHWWTERCLISLSFSLFLSFSLCFSIFLWLSTYLPTYWSICLSIYLSVCLSLSVSVYLPICLSTYLSVYLSPYLSTYLPTYLAV